MNNLLRRAQGCVVMRYACMQRVNGLEVGVISGCP